MVNPAVTWPNHTAMVTGVTPAKHGVLYNGMPVRTRRRKAAPSRSLGAERRTCSRADGL